MCELLCMHPSDICYKRHIFNVHLHNMSISFHIVVESSSPSSHTSPTIVLNSSGNNSRCYKWLSYYVCHRNFNVQRSTKQLTLSFSYSYSFFFYFVFFFFLVYFYWESVFQWISYQYPLWLRLTRCHFKNLFRSFH